MYNRRAAFLYKIDTDEGVETLVKKFSVFAEAKKIELDERNRPWRGFLVDLERKVMRQGVKASAKGIYFLQYGYEFARKINLFNGKSQIYFQPFSVSVVVDPHRKFLALQTSNKTLANEVFSMLQSGIEDKEYIKLATIAYPDDFLRWLVDNASSHATRMFKRLSGVKVDKLQNYDGNLNDAILNGDDEIGKSKVYKQIKNEGRHKYVIAFVRIESKDYVVRVYDHGQITIKGQPNEPISPLIPLIAEELEKLYNRFHSSV